MSCHAFHAGSIRQIFACAGCWLLQNILGCEPQVSHLSLFVQVRIVLPLEVMIGMEKCLLQQAGESSGLKLHLTSDFHKVEMPLQVHGGGSWVFSDIRTSSQLANDWFSRLPPGRPTC